MLFPRLKAKTGMWPACLFEGFSNRGFIVPLSPILILSTGMASAYSTFENP